MVNRVIADLYRDGSGILFYDQEQDVVCKRLEELLNSEKARDLIERGVHISLSCVVDIVLINVLIYLFRGVKF